MPDHRPKDRFPANRAPHPIEWIVGAASALSVAVLIGYLAITGGSEADGPAVFEASVDEIFPANGGWQVRVTVRNAGDKTAADVVLRGEVAAGDVESETVFDYVPAGSTRSGALLFDEEPLDLELSVRSYTDP